MVAAEIQAASLRQQRPQIKIRRKARFAVIQVKRAFSDARGEGFVVYRVHRDAHALDGIPRGGELRGGSDLEGVVRVDEQMQRQHDLLPGRVGRGRVLAALRRRRRVFHRLALGVQHAVAVLVDVIALIVGQRRAVLRVIDGDVPVCRGLRGTVPSGRIVRFFVVRFAVQQLICACGVRLGRKRHARDLLLRIDRQNGRVRERLKLRFAQRPAADGGGERPAHLRVLQLFVCVVDADIVQRRARCLQRIDRTADDRRFVVGCDARAAHDRHVARPEAGLRRVRPGDADQLDMADGAEKAAVPVFILFERVRAAVLDRHIRAGAVGEAAAVRAPSAVNRDVQQARKVRIGRGEHDAHLISARRFQRRHVGKAAVIGRGGVVHRRAVARDHIVCGQRLT